MKRGVKHPVIRRPDYAWFSLAGLGFVTCVALAAYFIRDAMRVVREYMEIAA